mgnify:CR=1 FL=1
MYDRLNAYLNDCCVYLDTFFPFFMDKMPYMQALVARGDLLSIPSSNLHPLAYHSCYESIQLVREFLQTLDLKYVYEFDHFVSSGELELHFHETGIMGNLHISNDRNLVTIDLLHTYQDAVTLAHEFFHFYSLNMSNCYTKTYILFMEFMPIYFEFLFIRYLKQHGYDDEAKNALFLRVESLKEYSNQLNDTLIPLRAYTTFGHIDSHTYNLMNSTSLSRILSDMMSNILPDVFEYTCVLLTRYFDSFDLAGVNDILDRGASLASSFTEGQLHVLGSYLAGYAVLHCKVEDILVLNEEIIFHDEWEPEHVFQKIGIPIHIHPNMYIRDMQRFIHSIYHEKQKIK